jgi:hypothetical protein
MSDFLVQLVALVSRIWPGESRRFDVLGQDYERREARRSAFWVGVILVVLLLAGWGIWRWMMGSIGQ